MISASEVPMDPNATFFAKLLGKKKKVRPSVYKATERVPSMSDRKQNFCHMIHGTKLY